MKGFTLFETLVAILIFIFIVGGMYGVLVIALTNYDTNLVSLNLQHQARQGMNRMVKEIRQAYWDDGVEHEIRIELDANGNNSITFDRFAATDVTYFLVSGKLWRGGTVIANDIGVLKFSKDLTKHLLKIQMQASKTFRSLGKDRTLTFFLTEQVQVRNL